MSSVDHQRTHEHGTDAYREQAADGATFWDDFYRDREQIWSGRPNPILVEVVTPLPAGTALDVGAGEGGDALWLAARGWAVTAVDIADVALERLGARARAEGLPVRTARHDLAFDRPAGRFDLVSAQYLHSPATDWDREPVLRVARDLVAPAGLLLVVGHGRLAPWSWDPTLVMPTADEVVAQLDLAAGEWTVEIVESREREVTGSDGQVASITDEIVAVRRGS